MQRLSDQCATEVKLFSTSCHHDFSLLALNHTAASLAFTRCCPLQGARYALPIGLSGMSVAGVAEGVKYWG